jgi:hypothetical protein
MKIRPVGAELFHADGRRDMTKIIIAFRNFANVPKHLSQYVRAGYPEHDAGTETISQLFRNTTSIFRVIAIFH